MAKVYFRVDGMEKLQADLKKLGKVPQKHVTAASRKGMTVVLRQAIADAPEDTGDLKKGMALSGERSRIKGKKVYRVVFKREMNHIFQKRNKAGEITGYYPISQEYGFFAVNGKYIPGFRFIHGSFSENASRVRKIILQHMQQKIDAEIVKAGLR